jgi:hypothetical protein
MERIANQERICNMQGPYHEFILLREGTYSYSDYMGISKTSSIELLKLSDDFVWYIHDTLLWIPSINPANPQEWIGYGLNLYGPTIITKDGSETAKQIFGAWATLFMHGPKNLVLRGAWVEPMNYGDDTSEERGYDTLLLDRDELVSRIKTLQIFADKAGSGEFFILHLGV